MAYIEQNLNKNEQLLKKAPHTFTYLLGAWIKGIFLCWLLLVPTVKAIIATVRYAHEELGVTTKRLMGKIGVLKSETLDAPLNKIQNVSADRTFLGRILGYGTIVITTAGGAVKFPGIKNADAFKGFVMNQVEEYEERRMKEQAQQMATAMAGAIRG